MLDTMERAVKAGDADQYHLQNLEFHDTLVAFTGHRKLCERYRRLINERSLFRRMNLADFRQLPVSASEHRAIVKAIACADADAAGLAMRQHVLDSKQHTQRNHGAPRAAASVRPASAPTAPTAPTTRTATTPAARKKVNLA